MWSPSPIASFHCLDRSCSLYPINNTHESAIIVGNSELKFYAWQLYPNSNKSLQVADISGVKNAIPVLDLQASNVLPSIEEHWKVKDAALYWNDRLITGGFDGILRFMDVKTGELTYQLELPKAIYCLKLVDDCYLITAGQGNVITVWDASAFKSESTKEVKEKALPNEVISSTPQLVPLRAIHSSHGYSVYALEVIALPIKCDKNQRSSSTASTITLMATGGREILIPLWDLNTGKEMLCVHVPDHIVIHSLAHLVLDHSCTACMLPSTNAKPPSSANYASYRKVPSEKHKQITAFRLFAGSDNGCIFCWDIVCDASIENYGTMNSSLTFMLSISRIDMSCVTDRSNERNNERSSERSNESERSESDRDLNENQHDELILEGCQGIFYGHENVVSTLLALIPLSTIPSTPSHNDFRNPIHHRPILVSASKDFSDVRLWLADFTFWPKKRSMNNFPFICQLTSGHSRPIKNLGVISRHQQTHQTKRNHIYSRVDLNNKGVDDGNIVCHLVTCGSDNKVCVWDVYQILKDLNWERIKWFVLLAKRISLISEHSDFRNDDRNSDSDPRNPLDPPHAHNNIKTCEKPEKSGKPEKTLKSGDIRPDLHTFKLDSKLDGTSHDLNVVELLEMKQLRQILIKIVSRQDILCAVCTFLM